LSKCWWCRTLFSVVCGTFVSSDVKSARLLVYTVDSDFQTSYADSAASRDDQHSKLSSSMRSGAGKAFARSAKQARPKIREMRDMLIDEPGGCRYVTHENSAGCGAVLYLCFRSMIAYAAFALVTADQCYTRTCMQDELDM
jgi:hypothetical protein